MISLGGKKKEFTLKNAYFKLVLESSNLKCLSCKINMEFSLAIFILLPLHFLLGQSWCNPPLIARCCLSCPGRGIRPPYSASFLPGFVHKLGAGAGSAFPCPFLGAPGTVSVPVPAGSFLLPGGNADWSSWEDALCPLSQCSLGGIWSMVTQGCRQVSLL